MARKTNDDSSLSHTKWNLKYKYGNRSFWAKGYFVSTVVMNSEVFKEYIRNQEKEDMMEDNLSTKEYKDPFKR